jgi:hypothetical protein
MRFLTFHAICRGTDMDTTPIEGEQKQGFEDHADVLLRRDAITDEMRREFAEMWRSSPSPRRVPESDTPRRDRLESEAPVSL